jgi:hypothetical protein
MACYSGSLFLLLRDDGHGVDDDTNDDNDDNVHVHDHND